MRLPRAAAPAAARAARATAGGHGAAVGPLVGPAARRPLAYHELYWAGAETSTSEWGRLDGAIESGQWAATQVLDFLQQRRDKIGLG
uniref:FAD-dependent oxidoreductase n=1 Tax=Hymenobacter roseosalivarius TaxID=89967 RepID=UPI00117A4F32